MTPPVPVRCELCGRRLKDPVYVARSVGPVCGGKVRTPRRSVAYRSPAVRVVVEETDDQMALFEVMIVRVAA